MTKTKKTDPSTARHMVNMSVDDKSRWIAAAKSEGLTLGAWIRRTCILAAGGRPSIADGKHWSDVTGVYASGK